MPTVSSAADTAPRSVSAAYPMRRTAGADARGPGRSDSPGRAPFVPASPGVLAGRTVFGAPLPGDREAPEEWFTLPAEAAPHRRARGVVRLATVIVRHLGLVGRDVVWPHVLGLRSLRWQVHTPEAPEKSMHYRRSTIRKSSTRDY